MSKMNTQGQALSRAPMPPPPFICSQTAASDRQPSDGQQSDSRLAWPIRRVLQETFNVSRSNTRNFLAAMP